MPNDPLARYKKYLPSKKFVYLIGGGALALILILVVSSYVGSSAGFNRDGGVAAISSDGTVKDIVLRDSNNNGIPDWEESLWGLDPTADGDTNKKTIEAHEVANGITPDTSGTPLTETDKFSQSLLATILALQQSGTLTEAAITNLSASVADSVDAKHVQAATYSMKDLTLSKTNGPAAKAAYEKALQNLLSQYDSLQLGTELSDIADALDAGDADQLKQLQPVADAYGAISRDIIQIPTPPAAAPYALVIANSSAQIENIYDDILTGMVGINDYVNASNASDAASDGMKNYFAS